MAFITIPKKAKAVFKGIIFTVYQWQQKLYDGSTTTFEMLKRPNTVKAICITPNKQILIVKDSQPNRKTALVLPGGRVDPNEKPEEAIKREILEETGYLAQHIKLWFTYQPVSKIVWFKHFFIATNLKKVGDPTPDAGEKLELLTYNFENFLHLSLKDEFKDLILKYRLLKALYLPEERKKLEKLLFSHV